MEENKNIVDEIDKTENLVKEHYERLSEIEQQLRQRKLPPPQEESARKEVDDIRNTLKDHEKTLKNLRRENQKSLAMVIVFVLIFFSLYVLFNLLHQSGVL